MHRDITPYDKSAHLLVVSSENWMVFTEFRQTSPARLIYFLKMRYDWMYSSQVYSGSPLIITLRGWIWRSQAAYSRTGGSCIFGGGLDRTCQSPRCSSIARITWRSSIALMTRIFPWHFGQIRGSTSYIFWISRAQLFLYAFSFPCGSRIQGTASSLPAFCRFPRATLL